MELLDLPNEILQLILVQSVAARGVKRGLRLRLVCKSFALRMYPALFTTHLMDDILYPYRGLRSGISSSGRRQSPPNCSAANIWQNYFVYRSLNERDSTIGRFVEIRQIACAVCQETELEFQSTIEALCYLTANHGAMTVEPWRVQYWGPTTRSYKVEPNLGVNMLTAAAYLNHLPLTRQLLADGCDPAHHNYLFPPPLQVAAQAGNAAILRLFQEKISETVYEPWSVNGAASRGDLDIVKLALRHDDNNMICGLQYGTIFHTWKRGKAIILARSYTSDPEVYDYLTGAIIPWKDAIQDSYYDMLTHAGMGNITMVRHLLHRGVPVQMKTVENYSPLKMACCNHQNNVADLLLESGADPNYRPVVSSLMPLHVSAIGSNLSLVKKLLDHGALVDRLDTGPSRLPILFWAFSRECESVVKFLLERGASFDGAPHPERAHDGWLGRELAEMTHHLGYQSMAQILQEQGFTISAPCKLVHKYKGNYWTSWEEATRVEMFGKWQ